MHFRQHLSFLYASQFGRGTFLGHFPSSYSSGTLTPDTIDPYLDRVRTGHTCVCTTGLSSGLHMLLTWHAFLLVLLSQAFTQHPSLESIMPTSPPVGPWVAAVLVSSAQHLTWHVDSAPRSSSPHMHRYCPHHILPPTTHGLAMLGLRKRSSLGFRSSVASPSEDQDGARLVLVLVSAQVPLSYWCEKLPDLL